MPDFALVAEGPTDHAVLKNILIGFLQEQREPEIHRDQPNSQSPDEHGGWTLVLKYLREQKYRQAFQTNQFVIIQIDADVAQDKGFDVPRQNQEGPLEPMEFLQNIVSRLKQEIVPEDLATYQNRLLFAVGVDQLECWLLPLWFESNPGVTVNCTRRLHDCAQLQDALNRKGFPWISQTRKDYRSYDLASKDYRKRSILMTKGQKNWSLARFLKDLAEKDIQLPEVE